MNSKFLQKLMLVSLICLYGFGAAAEKMGSEGRGGGDLCEDRIKTVRDDIRTWIRSGGHKAMSLPEGLTYEAYAVRMLKQIDIAKIQCVSQGDPGYPVQIDGVPKVCRFDLVKDGSFITCDSKKFAATGESEQYTLVHHEYAGLADLERPNGSDSTYHLSNQIAGNLVSQWVKRLAVKPQDGGVKFELMRGTQIEKEAWALGAALRATHFKDCHVRVDLDKTAPVKVKPSPKDSSESFWGSNDSGFFGNSYFDAYGTGEMPEKTNAVGFSTQVAAFTPRDLVNFENGAKTTTMYKSVQGPTQYKISYVPKESAEAGTQQAAVHLLQIFIDPSGAYIEKIGLQRSDMVTINAGTVLEPRYKSKLITKKMTYCHAILPE